MELRRVAGIDAASHALGHADLTTTLGIYGHQDDDLEHAMDQYAIARVDHKCSPRRGASEWRARA